VIPILLVQLVESGNLPPEGRSGVTAKNQNDWFTLRREGRQLNLPALIEFGQVEIRGGIAGMQRS